MAHRRKRIGIEDLTDILRSLSSLAIEVDRPDFDAVLELPKLAVQHQLSVYDAAYLELALRLGVPIATNDDGLKRAMASSGIEAVRP